jgi:hypothetical protein
MYNNKINNMDEKRLPKVASSRVVINISNVI